MCVIWTNRKHGSFSTCLIIVSKKGSCKKGMGPPAPPLHTAVLYYHNVTWCFVMLCYDDKSLGWGNLFSCSTEVYSAGTRMVKNSTLATQELNCAHQQHTVLHCCSCCTCSQGEVLWYNCGQMLRDDYNLQHIYLMIFNVCLQLQAAIFWHLRWFDSVP